VITALLFVVVIVIVVVICYDDINVLDHTASTLTLIELESDFHKY